jgi:hypothetical protein
MSVGSFPRENCVTPGDSLLILPGKGLTAPVTAPAGTTLWYMCTVHPWMQGSIVVTS